MSPVRVPPFYASPATWAAHIAIGGLKEDDAFAVRGKAGQVIPGLFACGEVRSGICGVGSIADGIAAGRTICA